MQNSALAIGIIGAQFNADFGMLMIASLWGIWHIVLNFTLAMLWRSKPIQYGEQLQVGSFGTVQRAVATWL